MSDQTDYNEKMWKLLNLQADTLLKVAQTRYEPWTVVVSAGAAGAALLAAGGALTAALLHFTR